MISIVTKSCDMDKEQKVDYTMLKRSSQKAIQAIKQEIPLDLQTPEVLEMILDQMKEQLKECRIVL